LLARLRKSEPRYLGRAWSSRGPSVEDWAKGGVADRRAALVIGDPALALEGRFPHVLDLGQAWFEWTGPPFLFAAWGARPRTGVSAADQDALRDALADGLSERAAIAHDHAK